jgi:hypothetical protein
MREVKELYETKLSEQTFHAAEIMREKVRVQSEYEDKLQKMAEEFRTSLLEHRDVAQRQLKDQVIENADAEKEFRQAERLRQEERAVLLQEHKTDMDEVRQKCELLISDRNNAIDRVRTDIVGQQDLYDGNSEQKGNYLSAIDHLQQEKQTLLKQQRVYMDQINDLRNELVHRAEQVTAQTAELMEMKSKNDELQKWRTVMDHRLNVLKNQIEPKQKQIVDLRRQIATDESQLISLKQTRRQDTDHQEKTENEIDNLYNAIIKTENSMSKCDARIKQFMNRVGTAYTEVDPGLWASELDKIHKEFVRDSVTFVEDPSITATLSEFARHTSVLAERVNELRVEVESDIESSGVSHLKQIRKNEDLMLALEVLRAENKKLKGQLHVIQTHINSLMRQCSKESKTLEAKVKTMYKGSANICHPGQVPLKRTFRSGTSVTVEQFT